MLPIRRALHGANCCNVIDLTRMWALRVLLCSVVAADLDARLAADGSYTLSVGGEPWLRSGATSLTANGATFTTADGSLKPQGWGYFSLSCT